MHDFASHHGRPSRGMRWLALAGGCAAAVLFVAVSTSNAPLAQRAAPARMLLDTAPSDAFTATLRLAALDAGVDWARVATAGDVASVAIAAYEP